MDRFRWLLLGGGMVAGYAARQMVEEGVGPGEICIVSTDSDPPYKRPPLSKEFLKDEKQEAEVFISEPGFYHEHGVELRLNTCVESVDLDAREIGAGPMTLGFENLLIATGAWPRRLNVPGADLGGVHLLRTFDHSRAIKRAAEQASRAVVVGGGFIGMELAAGLTLRGVECALVYREPQVMAGRFPAPIAAYFEGYYRERGVELLAEAEVAAIQGCERVTGMTLRDGRTLPADMVVIGVGVTPQTWLFKDSPLAIDDGILANEYLETGIEGVWVAGDVARYHDLIFDRDRRFEHADNAQVQGKHVAKVMLGQREPFRHVPNFYSDMFDLSWNYYGDHSLAERVVYRGEIKSGAFVAWWLNAQGRVMASFVLGIPWQEAELAARVIEQGKVIPEHVLADETRGLEELVEAD
ncbi:MAG: NAD(P)/FAD-dependent oxidoreductase [Armatimonadota bacterium]